MAKQSKPELEKTAPGEYNMADMRVISEEGKALIKKFEGCELQAYLCSASKLTIGYGHTGTTVEGMEITQEEAEGLLDQDLEQFENIVNSAVEVPLDQCEFDALVAWTFNLGGGNLRASTLLKVLNENKKNEVPAQMRRWNKATVNGEKVVLPGLERRREAEALLWQGKDWYDV